MSDANLPSATDPIRVLIVDDSAVIRGFVARALADVPEVVVVGSVGDGQSGINFVKRDLADVIILDIEMPVMDGLTALPQIVQLARWSRVIMSSTLTLHGAEVSIRAMALGAADYVSKPSSTRDVHAADEWKADLLEKVRALGVSGWRERRKLGKTGPLPAGVVPKPARAPSASAPSSVAAPRVQLYEGSEIKLRDPARGLPEILVIGSSTGGPQALFSVLPHLKGLRQPILITQHMPKAFTTILADHITKQTGLPCREAVTGDVPKAGEALLAPGEFHMLCEKVGSDVHMKLDQGPPENYCRPAVDPMLRSLIAAYGAGKILLTILTGMGSDGMRGAKLVVEGGGTVIAQDQATSVVWGMPGAVATAGLCSAILPLDEIGPWLRRRATGSLT